MVIEFANTGSLRRLATQGLFLVSGVPMPNGPVDSPQWQALADEQSKRDHAQERDQLRDDLAAIVAMNEARRRSDESTDGHTSKAMAMLPRLLRTGRLLQVVSPQGGHYLFPPTQVTAPLAYGTYLSAQGPSFTGLLCHCRLGLR